MAERQNGGGLSGVLDDLPTDELKEQARDLMRALGQHALSVASDKVGGVSGKVMDLAANGMTGSGSDGGSDGSGGSGSGGSPVKKLITAGASKAKDIVVDKVTGGGSGGKHKKTTDILEQIEVGVPLRVAYNQWTQFQDFPSFTKRIESVEQGDEQEVTWKAGIYFSHRTWKSTIVEQVPDERIVWHSQGDKGYVDGTVTFHEITPNLTKILLVLEYHPQGLFERTGNAFRSQRRRARLELHQFDRHLMRQVILDQDDLEGWRGEIRDGEVVRSHEEALEDEEKEENEENEDRDEDDYDDEYEDEEDQDEDQDQDQDADEPEGEDGEEPEDEYDDEYEDDEEPDDEDEGGEEPEDEYDDEYEDDEEPDDEEPDDEEPEDDEPEDEDEEPQEKRPSRRRRREPAGSR